MTDNPLMVDLIKAAGAALILLFTGIGLWVMAVAMASDGIEFEDVLVGTMLLIFMGVAAMAGIAVII